MSRSARLVVILTLAGLFRGGAVTFIPDEPSTERRAEEETAGRRFQSVLSWRRIAQSSHLLTRYYILNS